MAEYEGYVGAPYNFVGISAKVSRKKQDQLPPHNIISASLKSGRISYEIKAITPILVSAGKRDDKESEEFYKNCYGNYAIPGSTVRGLVRSNIQILSGSSVAEDIQDGILMYRNVANGKEKDAYNTVLGNDTRRVTGKDGRTSSLSVLKNVKAGYITKEDGKYVILPSVVDEISKDRGEMNYYVISERKIMEERYKGFEALKNMELQHVDEPLDKKTGSPFKKDVRGGRTHYIGKTNKKYKPYIKEVYYLLKGESQIAEIHPVEDKEISNEKKGFRKGFILSSGPMKEKKVIYVIPQIDEKGERIPIPPKDIDNYQRDYEGKKNQIETIDKTFYRLPQEGEKKPVFYIRLGGRLYFGFTPRLRLFYEKSIHEGLSEEQKREGVDYSKSLFGYSNEEESYKSRLSFMDAQLTQDKGQTDKDAFLILGGPKPTSYLDYLKGRNRQAVSYNQDFELRGVKQYWLKEKAQNGKVGQNEKVASRFRPYDKGAVFKGEIRFTNLTKEELGMVLWGLLLEKDSNQTIGKGKPYGYGRIEVRLTGLRIQDAEVLYGYNSLCLDPYKDEISQKDAYISSVKEELSRVLGRDVMKEPRIKDFLTMKDMNKIPPEDRTRYMELPEYQSRVRDLVCLPSVDDVVEGKKPLIPKREKKDFHEKTGNNQNQGKGGSRGNERNQRGKTGDKTGGRDTDYISGGSVGTSMADLLKDFKFN